VHLKVQRQRRDCVIKVTRCVVLAYGDAERFVSRHCGVWGLAGAQLGEEPPLGQGHSRCQLEFIHRMAGLYGKVFNE